MVCGRLDGRGVWGRMDTCMCVAEPLRCSLEAITTLLTGYIPIQKKSLKIIRKPTPTRKILNSVMKILTPSSIMF